MAKKEVTKTKEERVMKFNILALGAVVLCIVAVLAFLVGTVVGFNTALDSLSGCVQVDCEDIGVVAEQCEVCPHNDMLIKKTVKKQGLG